ncbi:MAG: hypothetical protein PUC12_11570 [Clostridiales bacterium]|nr:hypothetical protein [Clostridiales bacterium]
MVGGKTNDQILRVDGKGCFVEFMSGMFEPLKPGKLGKVLLNFVTYNEQNNQQTCLIPIYIDIPKFSALTDDIRYGRIKSLAAKEKQLVASGQKQYEGAIWKDMGGTSAKVLERQGKARADGMSESRVFEIVPARKENTFLLKATRGAGEEQNTNGIIAPKINYKDRNTYDQIQIPISDEDLRAVAKMIDIYIQAYYTSKWMSGGFLKTNNNQTSNPQQAAPTAQPSSSQQQQGQSQQQQIQQQSQPKPTQSSYGNITNFQARNSNNNNNNNKGTVNQTENISDEEEFPFESAI